MSRLLADIENTLQQMLAEHQRMLKLVELQQLAMRQANLDAMDQILQQQEASRLRIAKLENVRRNFSVQLQRQLGLGQEPNFARLIELAPDKRASLEKLRSELRIVAAEIQHKSSIAGRVAGALLGSLNTVVRYIATAAHQAGVYTKTGSPKVSNRIGVMEAVG